MSVTVGIKAYNEERYIAASIASAIAATRALGGSVVLADSGSTDQTVEIAKGFPVSIVRFADPSERCCGAAAQLAFQQCRSEYFYMLDGDMILDKAFLAAGVAYLEAHPKVAAVGGRVREINTESQEFAIRATKLETDAGWAAGLVDRLDCGGLYRAAAVRDVGYFADRNLHAFEEFDLAARLHSRRWTLARIDRPAVDHYGHAIGGYQLLWRRFRSGYAAAAGEVLRGALGERHLSIVLRRLGHVRTGAAVWLWWILLIASGAMLLPFALLLLLILPIGFLAFRRGSLPLGFYSFVSWNVYSVALAEGLLRKRKPPDQTIATEIVRKAELTCPANGAERP